MKHYRIDENPGHAVPPRPGSRVARWRFPLLHNRQEARLRLRLEVTEEVRQSESTGIRFRSCVGLLLSLSLLAGCATTTLRHPETGETRTCESGAWVGVGLVGIAVMIVGNVVESVLYSKCVENAKEAGYATE